jgi:hypothetical protein
VCAAGSGGRHCPTNHGSSRHEEGQYRVDSELALYANNGQEWFNAKTARSSCATKLTWLICHCASSCSLSPSSDKSNGTQAKEGSHYSSSALPNPRTAPMDPEGTSVLLG